MRVQRLHAVAYRLLGGYASQRVATNQRLQVSLLRAHIGLRPDVYLATGYLVFLLTVVLALVPSTVLVIMALGGTVRLSPGLIALLSLMPFVLALTSYAMWMVLPALRASGRARAIESRLPSALNYMATMASAGATPEKIFRRLAANRLYGEVAQEAAWIGRDVELLGFDIITALNAASERTPSLRFQEVIQGAVAALSSGGDLRGYFMSKSEQFLVEARHQQGRFLETLGVVAEAYVTVVVAAPLFLIVMLSVLVAFGSSMDSVLGLGYVMVLLVIPLAQLGFAVSVRQMAPGG